MWSEGREGSDGYFCFVLVEAICLILCNLICRNAGGKGEVRQGVGVTRKRGEGGGWWYGPAGGVVRRAGERMPLPP